MNALPRGPGNTVSPWLLDRDLVYAITAQKRLSQPRCDAGYRTTQAADSIGLATLTATELARLTGTSARDLLLLIDCGVFGALTPGGEGSEFRASLVPVLRRAQRMREDLALNKDEFALATFLLVEIDDVEAELRLLRFSGQSDIQSLAGDGSADDPGDV